MDRSRRTLIQTIAAGGAAFAAVGRSATALAEEQPIPIPPGNIPGASKEEHELKIVSIERLEDEARKILTPGRFAIMGPSGDGWTYRENRRAFNDFPIMPRRLQNVNDTDINLRTKLLGHDLSIPVSPVRRVSRAISTSTPNFRTPPEPAWRVRCSSPREHRTSRWKRSRR